MADDVDEIKTVLTAEDQTAAAFQSAIRNEERMVALRSGNERAQMAAARRAGISIDEYRKRTESFRKVVIDTTATTDKHTDSVNKNARAHDQSAGSHDKHTGALSRHSHELRHMVMEYTSTAAAIELARESFLKFGEQDATLRRIQVSTGAVRQELDALIPNFRVLSRDTKKPIDDILEGFKELQERAHLSVPQAQGLMPSIAHGAAAMGVSVKALGTVYGDLMQKFRLTPEDAPKVMDMMALSSNHMLLNAEELVSSLPRLTAIMRNMGYTGSEGVQKLLSYLAILRPSYGSASEAAMGLDRILTTMNNERVAMLNGMTPRAMMLTLDLARKNGKDVLAMYLAMLKSAMNRGLVLGEISQREQLAIGSLLEGLKGGSKEYEHLGHATGEVGRTTKIVTRGALADWNDVKNSVSELMTELGGLAYSIDQSLGSEKQGLIAQFSDKIRDLRKLVGGDFSDEWKKLKKDIDDTFTPPKALGTTSGGEDISGESRQEWLRRRDRRRQGITPNQSQRFRPMPGGTAPGPYGELPFQSSPEVPMGDFSPISYNPERDLKDQSGTLHEIREILRQMKEASGGNTRVMNASYSPGGGVPSGSGGGGGGMIPGGGGGASALPGAGPRAPWSWGGGGGVGGGGGGAGGGGSQSPFRDRYEEGRPPPPGSVAPGREGVPGGTGGQLESGGGGGFGADIPMTADERNKLGLILQHESKGKNVMNYMGRAQGLDPQTAKGYTAQGYYQMLNSNWRRIAPGLGITAPNAMSASFRDQTRVALALMRQSGIKNWSNYNPALRAALNRGDRASNRFAINEGGGQGQGPQQGAQRQSNAADGINQYPWAPGGPEQGSVDPGSQQWMDERGSMAGPGMGQLQQMQDLRSELEKPITIQTRMEAGDTQFRRSSINREVNREQREASWNSYADIGAA
jgi:TP901 family phage tail tape measure protein